MNKLDLIFFITMELIVAIMGFNTWKFFDDPLVSVSVLCGWAYVLISLTQHVINLLYQQFPKLFKKHHSYKKIITKKMGEKK